MTFQTLLTNYRKHSFSERDKGDRFERLMQAYLKTDPKYAYRIQAEFKAAVNKIYDKLKVDSQEASQMSYRSRFENTKDQPDAGRIINRERNGLQFKIDSLPIAS